MAEIDNEIVPNFKKDLTLYFQNRDSISLYGVRGKLIEAVDDLF